MWRLLDLGAVNGYTMTNLYEAVGKAVGEGESPNTVILNHPETPFVNIGFHQLMEKEINVEYALEKGFLLVRRTIGGGAILDGPWEQDYFVIIKRGDPDCPATIPEFYQKFLKPTVYALRKLGLKPTIRPPNDILVENQKISGNGAITIDRVNVLAGDLLLEAPTELMSEIIKSPGEKFKDKLAQSMTEWITSIKTLTGEGDREKVKRFLVEGFVEELGITLEPMSLTVKEKKILEELIEERKTEEWIFNKDNDLIMKIGSDAKGIKVRGGVTVSESVYKAGKMIRVVLVTNEGNISDISISGDFFTIPYSGAVEQLEQYLIGTPLNVEALTKKIKEGFMVTNLMVIGATQEDFVKAIMKTKLETEPG